MTIDKIFWAVALVISVVVGGVMLYDVYKKYKSYTKFECFMQSTFVVALWVVCIIIIKYAF